MRKKEDEDEEEDNDEDEQFHVKDRVWEIMTTVTKMMTLQIGPILVVIACQRQADVSKYIVFSVFKNRLDNAC